MELKIEWQQGGKQNTVIFGVTGLPNRKSKCLYIQRGAVMDILAYFRDDDSAERFEKVLILLAKIFDKEG